MPLMRYQTGSTEGCPQPAKSPCEAVTNIIINESISLTTERDQSISLHSSMVWLAYFLCEPVKTMIEYQIHIKSLSKSVAVSPIYQWQAQGVSDEQFWLLNNDIGGGGGHSHWGPISNKFFKFCFKDIRKLKSNLKIEKFNITTVFLSKFSFSIWSIIIV